MLRYISKLMLGLGTLLALSANLHAQHAGDIDIDIVNGRIVTGARVYGVTLGDTFDYYADEPGYDALPGTFAANTSVGWDILGALKVWNGTNFNTIAMPRLLMQNGPSSVLSPTTNSLLTGLSSNTNATGEWHKHFGLTLVDAGGNPLPPANPMLAETGIYLLELQLRTTQPGIDNSLPYYLVINNGVSLINHDAAIAHVNAVAIPEPGTWIFAVSGVGCLWLAYRKRQQHHSN